MLLGIRGRKRYADDIAEYELIMQIGEFSRYLRLCMDDLLQRTFIFVDRDNHKRKHDAFVKYQENTFIERHKLDIKDFDLSSCKKFSETHGTCLAYGKHLCGGATDMALYCITKSIQKNRLNEKIKAIGIALCCHHRLSYSSFINPEYLSINEVDEKIFELLRSWSCWATSGWKTKSSRSTQLPHTSRKLKNGFTLSDQIKAKIAQLSPEEKENIGLKSKRFFDQGRVEYLQRFGFTAKLVPYTEKSVTLENIFLLATK